MPLLADESIKGPNARGTLEGDRKQTRLSLIYININVPSSNVKVDTIFSQPAYEVIVFKDDVEFSRFEKADRSMRVSFS